MANEADSGAFSPFSPEKAWQTWEDNRDTSLRLREEVRTAGDDAGTLRERLLKTVEIVGRLTDNTILLRIIRQALEARDQACEES